MCHFIFDYKVTRFFVAYSVHRVRKKMSFYFRLTVAILGRFL